MSAVSLVLALRGAAAIAVLGALTHGLPRVVQAGIALLFGAWSALIADPTPLAAVARVDELALVAVREVVIGAALGLVAALPLLAAATAGRLVDAAGPPGRGYSALFGVLAAAVFVGVDGHVAALAALADSFRAVPVIAAAGAPPTALAAIGGLVGAAVGLAIPWLVTAAVVEIAVGVGLRVGGRAALHAPASAAAPAALAMMTAALVGTLAVGVAALVR